MENYSPEVLIYVQSIKNYFDTNENAREYFLKNVNYDIFFENLARISEINLKKNGEPQLTTDQFEFLRITMEIFNKIDGLQENETIYTYDTKNIKFTKK